MSDGHGPDASASVVAASSLVASLGIDESTEASCVSGDEPEQAHKKMQKGRSRNRQKAYQLCETLLTRQAAAL